MELTFKQLEKLLHERFGVNEEGESAFRGRIQHLQRAKVPAGVNTGKGRAAIYGWSQVIELMAVLDLIDAGLAPESARKVVGQKLASLHRFASSFGAATDAKELAGWVKAEQCPLDNSLIVLASAGTLHALSGGEEIIFECMSGPHFVATIADGDSYRPASCFINLSKRLLSILNVLRLRLQGAEGEAIGMDGIIADFRSWALTVPQEPIQ